MSTTNVWRHTKHDKVECQQVQCQQPQKHPLIQITDEETNERVRSPGITPLLQRKGKSTQEKS